MCVCVWGGVWCLKSRMAVGTYETEPRALSWVCTMGVFIQPWRCAHACTWMSHTSKQSEPFPVMVSPHDFPRPCVLLEILIATQDRALPLSGPFAIWQRAWCFPVDTRCSPLLRGVVAVLALVRGNEVEAVWGQEAADFPSGHMMQKWG